MLSCGLSVQSLQSEIQNLKDQVQELHRDLTKHHSLIKAEIMADILHKSLQVDTQIALQCASVEAMRTVFEEVALPRNIIQLRHDFPPVSQCQNRHGRPHHRKEEEALGLVCHEAFVWQVWEPSSLCYPESRRPGLGVPCD